MNNFYRRNLLVHALCSLFFLQTESITACIEIASVRNDNWQSFCRKEKGICAIKKNFFYTLCVIRKEYKIVLFLKNSLLSN